MRLFAKYCIALPYFSYLCSPKIFLMDAFSIFRILTLL